MSPNSVKTGGNGLDPNLAGGSSNPSKIPSGVANVSPMMSRKFANTIQYDDNDNNTLKRRRRRVRGLANQ